VGSKVLIIVENLTVPLDRRVWTEACALRDAGYTVSVICPKMGKYTRAYEVLEDIHIFRHAMPYEADGALGYALEYGWALAAEFALCWKAWRKVGFDVIQACNPPDTIFLIGAFFKYLMGKPFIFDHHDINPELFEAKFGRHGALHRLMTFFEWATFKTADAVISTNETFRSIAINRGGVSPDRVRVVRSVPDVARFKRASANTALKNDRRHLVGYVGIMGAQDGVDLLIRAMAHIVHIRGRKDVQALIVGSGTELPALQALTAELGVEDYVTFTGFLSGEALLTAFSTFDIGVIPDPKNVYNDKISMNKVFEYMTLGIPFVQFDLMEGRKAAGDSALYACDNDPIDLGMCMTRLLDDPGLRERMSVYAKERAAALLSWESERAQLLATYDDVLNARDRVPVGPPREQEI
jgi:glycosyltransferase involved in cell wall biosynthesis